MKSVQSFRPVGGYRFKHCPDFTPGASSQEQGMHMAAQGPVPQKLQQLEFQKQLPEHRCSVSL